MLRDFWESGEAVLDLLLPSIQYPTSEKRVPKVLPCPQVVWSPTYPSTLGSPKLSQAAGAELKLVTCVSGPGLPPTHTAPPKLLQDYPHSEGGSQLPFTWVLLSCLLPLSSFLEPGCKPAPYSPSTSTVCGMNLFLLPHGAEDRQGLGSPESGCANCSRRGEDSSCGRWSQPSPAGKHLGCG